MLLEAGRASATLPARALAPGAQRWLRGTRRARVLNVFERACNLVNERGRVLTLLAGGMDMSPLGLALAGGAAAPFREVSTQGAIAVGLDALAVDGLRVALDTACLWDPVPDWARARRALDNARDLLWEVGAWARRRAPAGSLLDLWPEAEAEPLLMRNARAHAASLARGLAAGNAAQAAAGARGLAGLGGGLTPAGDDFIVGVCLAAWAGLYGPGAEDLCPALAEAAAPRTTLLSAAYLRAAARGECLEKWHRVLAALSDLDLDRLEVSLADLLQVGHTSGADALAGFLASAMLHTKE